MEKEFQINLDRDLAETRITVFQGDNRTEIYARLRACRELLSQITQYPQTGFLLRFPPRESVLTFPRIELIGKGLTVGRGHGADWIIQDTSTRLSNRHFQVRAGRDGYELRDLSSTNGTYLNECSQRIKGALLCHGDVIQAGGEKFLFALGSNEADPA